jgi:hypothetical protein
MRRRALLWRTEALWCVAFVHQERAVAKTARTMGPTRAEARCACGDVVMEIAVPAQWAWHDHSRGSRAAHGAAYATYVGTWKSRFRFVRGEDCVTRYEADGRVRGFCARCGTPVTYERSAQHVNIPRALFTSGVGREPRYHIAIDELQEWTYLGEPLGPLKGFPGVVWNKGRRKRG